MARIFLILLLTVPVMAETTVTILHVSDYHSHALPHYTSEGLRGGVARVYEFLRAEKAKGALVFNGGDTMNRGAPAWSDRYRCTEWAWFNGITDAMALGNHEADYGLDELQRCRASARYPLLSANTEEFRRYALFDVEGVTIGVFAVAGADFPALVGERLRFSDPVAAAREVVRELREDHRAAAVVLIGHQHAEADHALAREVGGIDLILGTHSHVARELEQIGGTRTWLMSPGQYLSHISRVELTFDEGRLREVRGRLIAVDESLPENRGIARRVARMQRALERDPEFRELFVPFARLDSPLDVEQLAGITVEQMRMAAGADVALSTVSSFRRPLPPGALTMELLRGALPYDNEIVTCTMDGATLQRVLDFSASRKGTGSEAATAGGEGVDPSATYVVAATDYLANVAYRTVFICDKRKTNRFVREELRRVLAASSSASR